MHKTFIILAAATGLSACVTTQPDQPRRGLEPLNVPVVSRQDYVFDASAPDGSLSATEQARLSGWFSGLQLAYGDKIYVDGPYADAARRDVAKLAGNYGLLLSGAAPMTQGEIAPGMVRVIVSRTKASVPNCPNWSWPSEKTLDNYQHINFGCGVNGNLAAMIANPEDLVRGRDASGTDSATGSKAVDSYRTSPNTGKAGLPPSSTK